MLVGLDGSESSFKAADYAILFAKHYGSELIAIHVIPSKSVMGHSSGMFGVVTPAFLKKVTEEAEKWFTVIKKKTDQLIRSFGAFVSMSLKDSSKPLSISRLISSNPRNISPK